MVLQLIFKELIELEILATGAVVSVDSLIVNEFMRICG